MIKKIVTLSVSFVLGFVAIFFSIHASAFSGKGSGKNAAVKDPKELADIIAALPKSADYEAPDGIDGDFKTLTLHDSMQERYSVRRSSSSSGTGSSSRDERKSTTTMSQEFDIYFAKDAAYYVIDAKIINEDKSESNATLGNITTSEKTTTVTQTEMSVEYYISAKNSFIKYNKYEILSESFTYKDGELVEEKEDDEPDQEELMQKELLKTIRNNYGKWIQLNYDAELDFDFDSPEPPANMTEEDGYKAMAQYMCVMLGEELVNVVKQANDTNIDTLKKIGVCLVSYNDTTAYKKSGNYYAMTDLALKSFITSLATNMSKINYDDGSFIINLADKTAPSIMLDIGYSVNDSSSSGSSGLGSYSSSYNVSYDHSEEIKFNNIGNTVLPSVPKSAKSLYDFLGKALIKILKDAQA